MIKRLIDYILLACQNRSLIGEHQSRRIKILRRCNNYRKIFSDKAVSCIIITISVITFAGQEIMSEGINDESGR